MSELTANNSIHGVQNAAITGVILAGGEGRRMDGADKGLLEISGITLLETIIGIFEPQVATLLISANRNLSTYKKYGYRVVTDTIAGNPGPLGGVLSAMDHCDTELLLTVPCDAPLLAHDYAARMVQSISRAGKDAGVAYDGTRIQPVYALLHQKHMSSLQNYLQSGNHSAQDWIKTLHPVTVDFSDQPQQFLNLNTPADRKIIEGLLEDR